MSSADLYAKMVDASTQQRDEMTHGRDADRWGAIAARFRADPHRVPEPVLQAVLEYIAPRHIVLDVGGGAGRYALPIALRCRQVLNVEPSPGMGAAFEASAMEAGISNARWVCSGWNEVTGLSGEVSIAAHVTYFVRDILPFLERLASASRERVVIVLAATPPPNRIQHAFNVAHALEFAPVPGYQELLAVLWDMGILPDVRVLDYDDTLAPEPAWPTREQAIDELLVNPLLSGALPRARERVDARFDELFDGVPGAYQRRQTWDRRTLLITWPTSQ